MELLETFISPVKMRQKNLVWAFPVPKPFVGKPYNELARHYFSEGVVPLGLLRGQTGPLPYTVIKLPKTTTIVEEADALYALASITWAEKNMGKMFQGDVKAENTASTGDESPQTEPAPLRSVEGVGEQVSSIALKTALSRTSWSDRNFSDTADTGDETTLPPLSGVEGVDEQVPSIALRNALPRASWSDNA
jgi:hypothetical protein